MKIEDTMKMMPDVQTTELSSIYTFLVDGRIKLQMQAVYT